MVDGDRKNDLGYIFTSIDCTGRHVALKRGTFAEKILKKHRELTAELIKEGIEFAHIVARDPEDSGRRSYYRIIINPVEGRTDFTNIKVVVEETKDEYDEIVTAHLVRHLKTEKSEGGILYDAGFAGKS
ncbi:hypothetical protein MSSIH_0647 [Methanosarcina siciliae HI350]|uniref:Uncharacterized protein n=1 Tax=Methanosarcina siciliae HI350 TaxID=1434119 RepID=A0A0E3PAZ0_9EURY|nr:3-dehydroquinate synthase [Methanosarcina siciliae]AKB31337.1 hypothetical protein MSSIH_0647 [Methanosarcina siciliae HI350]